MTSTRELFNTDVDLECRLGNLVGWVERRRGEKVGKADQCLLANLLGAGAKAIPLHLIFPDEPAMDLTLLNAEQPPEDAPLVEEALIASFIWRHTHLDHEQIDGLQLAELKYQAILGLVSWNDVFDTQADFDSAVNRYEIIVHEGEDGHPVHEDDVFWYVAARDGGFSQKDATAFSRFRLLYLFAVGVATDDVGITLLAH